MCGAAGAAANRHERRVSYREGSHTAKEAFQYLLVVHGWTLSFTSDMLHCPMHSAQIVAACDGIRRLRPCASPNSP